MVTVNALLLRSRRLAVSLAVVLSLFGSLFVGVSSADAAIVRGTVLEQKIAWAVGAMMNRERVANHVPPVGMEPHMVVAAMKHNWNMARQNLMSHQVRGELSLGARLDAAGYHWSWAGENVAWSSNMSAEGVLALQSVMYNEKAPYNGHRLNILNPHFKHVGINVYFDYVHHKVWLTTDFGRLM